MTDDRFSPFLRDYRAARREYGLPADLALAYARQRRTLQATELVIGYELDCDGGVAVLVGDLDGNVLASLGGVDVSHQVSDHGNLNLDDRDPWLVALAASLVREVAA